MKLYREPYIYIYNEITFKYKTRIETNMHTNTHTHVYTKNITL
jgi:hypothetical protein